MKPLRTTGGEDRSGAQTNDHFPGLASLDAQFSELIEVIWASERQWTIDDRIDAAIRYAR